MNNILSICVAALKAARSFVSCGTDIKNDMLRCIACKILSEAEFIKQANLMDIEKALSNGRDKTFIDRLTLTDSRIKAMSEGVMAIVNLPDPAGETVSDNIMPNGLRIRRVRSPLGVVGVIYEARPNVTVDCAALTIKSGNVVILRGSKDAINSNRALYGVIINALKDNGYNYEIVQFIDDEARESSLELLQMDQYVDIIIPRGGDELKNWVLNNSRIPVIASAGGNCHTYVEASADINMAVDIVYNAKVQRPSVCNACEQLLVDSVIAKEFLPLCLNKLKQANVRLLGCERTREIYPEALSATEEDYYTEHLDYVISIKVVDGLMQAIEWINEHNTKHSECIVTSNMEYADIFTSMVDAAAVYVNASTRFTDGYELGMGAEMGISTQKLHVRGPIGLRELTSTKLVINGNGQIRQ